MSEVTNQIALLRNDIVQSGCELLLIDDALGGCVFFYPEALGDEATANVDNLVVRAILQCAGFTFHEDRLSDDLPTAFAIGIPDMERFSNAATANSLPITFHDELEPRSLTTPVSQFVDTYRAGRYPVGIGDLDLFVHDVSFDHLPAIIVCGDWLMKLTQRIPETNDRSEYVGQGVLLEAATANISQAILSLILNDDEHEDQLQLALNDIYTLTGQSLSLEALEKAILENLHRKFLSKKGN